MSSLKDYLVIDKRRNNENEEWYIYNTEHVSYCTIQNKSLPSIYVFCQINFCDRLIASFKYMSSLIEAKPTDLHFYKYGNLVRITTDNNLLPLISIMSLVSEKKTKRLYMSENYLQYLVCFRITCESINVRDKVEKYIRRNIYNCTPTMIYHFVPFDIDCENIMNMLFPCNDPDYYIEYEFVKVITRHYLTKFGNIISLFNGPLQRITGLINSEGELLIQKQNMYNINMLANMLKKIPKCIITVSRVFDDLNHEDYFNTVLNKIVYIMFNFGNIDFTIVFFNDEFATESFNKLLNDNKNANIVFLRYINEELLLKNFIHLYVYDCLISFLFKSPVHFIVNEELSTMVNRVILERIIINSLFKYIVNYITLDNEGNIYLNLNSIMWFDTQRHINKMAKCDEKNIIYDDEEHKLHINDIGKSNGHYENQYKQLLKKKQIKFNPIKITTPNEITEPASRLLKNKPQNLQIYDTYKHIMVCREKNQLALSIIFKEEEVISFCNYLNSIKVSLFSINKKTASDQCRNWLFYRYIENNTILLYSHFNNNILTSYNTINDFTPVEYLLKVKLRNGDFAFNYSQYINYFKTIIEFRGELPFVFSIVPIKKCLKIQGGLFFQRPGIYVNNNVYSLDFNSYYPSIIKLFKLSFNNQCLIYGFELMKIFPLIFPNFNKFMYIMDMYTMKIYTSETLVIDDIYLYNIYALYIPCLNTLLKNIYDSGIVTLDTIFKNQMTYKKTDYTKFIFNSIIGLLDSDHGDNGKRNAYLNSSLMHICQAFGRRILLFICYNFDNFLTNFLNQQINQTWFKEMTESFLNFSIPIQSDEMNNISTAMLDAIYLEGFSTKIINTCVDSFTFYCGNIQIKLFTSFLDNIINSCISGLVAEKTQFDLKLKVSFNTDWMMQIHKNFYLYKMPNSLITPNRKDFITLNSQISRIMCEMKPFDFSDNIKCNFVIKFKYMFFLSLYVNPQITTFSQLTECSRDFINNNNFIAFFHICNYFKLNDNIIKFFSKLINLNIYYISDLNKKNKLLQIFISSIRVKLVDKLENNITLYEPTFVNVMNKMINFLS
ncbi:ATP-binding cassette transporter-like protein [Glossina pallidipes salivary gland hypertrophy virus]|uniref:ATP-binding cassette transporter-like protein n=1 Tax=Glossina hytrovirus (isolate Glossina pallidipes/Ethiopia/Seibersdorf/-) TaxID=379529 RepID=B0YLN1_GHVS|nr:ATP-binding cassette transporter-like protein [Glossina pallidipes salivary gland hypertrophy virus]ABQ08850.1 ATP-binding cassette transporter-like protein [Glossina pallidipes salivary gland hypertrophy virus]